MTPDRPSLSALFRRQIAEAEEYLSNSRASARLVAKIWDRLRPDEQELLLSTYRTQALPPFIEDFVR
jgi:hypothetical protein